jgi:hypothetical protein
LATIRSTNELDPRIKRIINRVFFNTSKNKIKTPKQHATQGLNDLFVLKIKTDIIYYEKKRRIAKKNTCVST